MWTTIRFVHVLSAIAWVGVQLTLFMLFPVLRRSWRRAVPDGRTHAGMRLGIVAVITLPALLASGIALASHQVPGASAAG